MSSKLYLVSTPIGNYDDISFRAIDILKSVDFVICEEFKEARRLLSHYKIEKELISLNEHNEKDASEEILPKLKSGKSAALISDCGTPLFSDPGHYLVDLCLKNKIGISPIPGVSSLLPAITASGLKIEKFYYYGWLSPKKDLRKKELIGLKNLREAIIILDTPYRLRSMLADIMKVFNQNTKVVLAFELTKDGEKFYRGTLAEISNVAEQLNLKGEFVLLIDNRNLIKIH